MCTKCGINPKVKPRSHCQSCLTEKHRQFVKDVLAKGMCMLCFKAAHSQGYQTCEECREARALLGKTKRDANKAKAIQYLGGKCIDCGLQSEHISVYDFDHRDPTTKEGHIAKLMDRSWEVLLPELDKCDLRCANCHRIRHAVEGYNVHWRRNGLRTK